MGAQLRKLGILKEKNKMIETNGKIGDSMLMILPEEIVTKILVTLPVKSLLRLRCVNKSLNSLLKNPYFIDLHMKQQHKCILISSRGQTFLYFHSYESLSKIAPLLEIPYFNSNEFNVSWPCNGLLVCAAARTSMTVLCNPATREFKLLPSSPFHGMEWAVISVGLGFDSKRNDYKVVITLTKTNSDSVYMTELYNLSSNSWRQINHEIPLIYGASGVGGVPFNGALHWIARKKSVDFILSFNVSTEVFQDMVLPDTIAHTHEIFKIPTIINDSLALFAFIYSEPKFVEIWVMKEGSWAKHISIHGITFSYYIYPCLLWKNETILMSIDSLNLKVCTLDTQIISDTGIVSTNYASQSVLVYKESLVSKK